MQANEETPPALAPLFKVADVLEQEKNTDKTLAAQKILDAAQNYTSVPSDWWDYIGKGGTIYVHVLNLDVNDTKYPGSLNTKVINNKTKQSLQITKEHYQNAANIANERYKKLDVNLKVVIIFDENAKPLTKEEFIQRKADKERRKALPQGLASEYNPMDTYMAVDNVENIQKWQSELGTSDTDWSYPSDVDKAKKWDRQLATTYNGTDFAGTNIKVMVGNANPDNFLAWVNSNNLGTHIASFMDQDKEEMIAKNGERELNNTISEALAILIEHESSHIKFTRYAENNGSSSKDNLEIRSSAGRTAGGHVINTIMDEKPTYSLCNNTYTNTETNTDTYLGYDIYMQTMLQLLHGRHPENHDGRIIEFDKSSFFSKMYMLDSRRKKIQADLLKMKAELKLNTPEGIEKQKAFHRLDRITSAHFDILKMLTMRKDTSEFIESKKLQKQLKAHKTHGQQTQETSPQD